MFNKYFYISSLAILISACTQAPAPIVMKGQQSFSRNNQQNPPASSNKTGGSYDNNGYNTAYTSPIPENTEQKVSVDSIGISDLAPPSATSKPAESTSISPPPQIEKKSEPGTIKKQTINPWTNKPRSDNETQTNILHISKVKPEPEPVELVSNEEVSTAETIDKTEDKVAEKPVEQKKVAKAKSLSGFKWPVASTKIISSFGEKGDGKVNDGVNIAANEGDPVWAAADGEVVYVSNAIKGYGNMILIKHTGNITTTYAHLSRTSVDKYDRVNRGNVIGYAGSTGDVKNPQLFFSVHKGKEAVDPMKYTSSEITG
jgi:murein DD-endopeptidase MepM/ murein hydrolase activator NlpD